VMLVLLGEYGPQLSADFLTPRPFELKKEIAEQLALCDLHMWWPAHRWVLENRGRGFAPGLSRPRWDPVACFCEHNVSLIVK